MTPDDLLTPVGGVASMRDEPLLFVAGAGQPSGAGLLYRPRTIESVRHHATGAAYHEGSDFVVDHTSGTLWRTAASRMPLVAPDALVAHDAARMHARLVAVSYVHDGTPPLRAMAASPARALERTRQRLSRGQPLSICVLGDSISEGYDASAFHGVAPMQPAYPTRVATELERRHRAAVRLTNLAAAGSSADGGRWLVDQAVATAPDLLLVAYGMNDAGWSEPADYAAHISAIVAGARAARPDVEVVLVAPMLPTPSCHWVDASLFPRYRDALVSLAGAHGGMVVADVTTTWSAVLRRKSPYDLAGNGTNHPNDFGHRLYAQTVLEAIDPAAP